MNDRIFMDFLRYIHLERFGNDEVSGIEQGECWVFPKLDGTNASVWSSVEGGARRIYTGSRNRKLPVVLSNGDPVGFADDVKCNDNQGFAQYIGSNREVFSRYFEKYPNLRLYGEWLVPHAFKGYRKDAWNRFYVFDVSVAEAEQGNEHFLPFDRYELSLKEFNIDYVIPQCKIFNGDFKEFNHELKNNYFLCEDGEGPGEGIVIKNYGFYNRFGRQIWAKLVRNEYKERHTSFHGVSVKEFGQSMEEKIINEFVTEAFIEKEYHKILNEKGGWNSKYIPMLFGKCFYELVHEESWNILKKFGQKTTINYGALYAGLIVKIKKSLPEVF